MSLVQDYCIICDKEENYILKFNTSEGASVTYTREKDGTNVININTAKKGETSFSENFGNKNKSFKFIFNQPEIFERKRTPTGSLTGG